MYIKAYLKRRAIVIALPNRDCVKRSSKCGTICVVSLLLYATGVCQTYLLRLLMMGVVVEVLAGFVVDDGIAVEIVRALVC